MLPGGATGTGDMIRGVSLLIWSYWPHGAVSACSGVWSPAHTPHCVIIRPPPRSELTPKHETGPRHRNTTLLCVCPGSLCDIWVGSDSNPVPNLCLVSPPRPRSQFQIFDRDVVLLLAESRQEFLVEYGFFEAIDEARIYVIMERKFNLKYSIKGVSVPSLKLVGMAVLMVRTSPLTETIHYNPPQSVSGWLCRHRGC